MTRTEDVTDYIRTKNFTPNTMLALGTLVSDIGNETALYKEMNIPNDRVRNFRNDMYLISEAIRLMQKSGNFGFAPADTAILANYKKHIGSFHPIHTSLGKGRRGSRPSPHGALEAHRRVTVGERRLARAI